MKLGSGTEGIKESRNVDKALAPGGKGKVFCPHGGKPALVDLLAKAGLPRDAAPGALTS